MSRCGCHGERCNIAADDPRHGTQNGYGNLYCRCQPCADAWAVAHLDYMQRHPDQYRKQSRREARRRDPDGSKAAAWAERQAARRRRQAETEIRQARNDKTRKLIFELRDEGMSYDDIVRTLAGRGIPTMRPDGVQWHKGTIWHIINGSDVRR